VSVASQFAFSGAARKTINPISVNHNGEQRDVSRDLGCLVGFSGIYQPRAHKEVAGKMEEARFSSNNVIVTSELALFFLRVDEGTIALLTMFMSGERRNMTKARLTDTSTI
jgi:hypothetical protein